MKRFFKIREAAKKEKESTVKWARTWRIEASNLQTLQTYRKRKTATQPIHRGVKLHRTF